MSPDCRIGRIGNVDDFKHLARKFTHTILDKELTRTSKLDELDFEKRIKVIEKHDSNTILIYS